MNLSAEIREYISKNNGFCKVYPAPFAVFLNKDDKTYVEPDISVICDKSKLDDRGCNGAPDFIIEIVYHHQAEKWIILPKMLYILMPESVNTGLLIPKNSARQFTAMKKMLRL